MTRLDYPAPGDAKDRVLLIMLPGAGIAAGAFAAHGLVAAAQAGRDTADVIALQPDLELYLDGGIAAAVHREVIAPARAEGRGRVWLLGISLGAMGALLTAAAGSAAIEGLILLAPFLGTKGTIAELEFAGGLDRWRAESSAATAPEQTMLRWLRDSVAARPAAPALYLGYGEADRFAAGHRLLARQLPPARVFSSAGGHDWDSWTRIFRAVLNARPFAARPELDDHAPS